jgi:hypothetical protein
MFPYEGLLFFCFRGFDFDRFDEAIGTAGGAGTVWHDSLTTF